MTVSIYDRTRSVVARRRSTTPMSVLTRQHPKPRVVAGILSVWLCACSSGPPADDDGTASGSDSPSHDSTSITNQDASDEDSDDDKSDATQQDEGDEASDSEDPSNTDDDEESDETSTSDTGDSDASSESDSADESTGDTGGPDCIDQQIFDMEQIPERVNIDDLIDSYNPDTRQAWAIEVLERRYPTGAYILREANNHTNCFEIAFSDTKKPESILGGLRTAIHECGHMIDLNAPTGFVIWADLRYDCDFSIPGSGPGRGIILNDEFQSRWPGDSFKDTYLDQLGDQTFELLLNEASQYINTLASSYAFYDFTTFDPVARDGAHAFYWYITRYLRMVRMKHAEFYERLVNDQCWRELILVTWGRSERYLVESEGLAGLGGPDDALLGELRNDPELVGEIERLRALHGCP